jgi:hypothetical protein
MKLVIWRIFLWIMMKMIFSVDLDSNKVVDNLLIYLVPNFHGYRLNGLRVTAVLSL